MYNADPCSDIIRLRKQKSGKYRMQRTAALLHAETIPMTDRKCYEESPARILWYEPHGLVKHQDDISWYSRSLDDTTPPSSARYHSLPSLRPMSPYHASWLDLGLALISIGEAIDSLISSPEHQRLLGHLLFFPIEMVSVSPRTNYNHFLNRCVCFI